MEGETRETAFIKAIQDGHSVRILIYLLNNGRSVRTSVYYQASNSANTAKNKIDHMIDSNLIKEVEEPFPPKRKWVELTDKGRKVAEKLAEIEGILEG